MSDTYITAVQALNTAITDSEAITATTTITHKEPT